MNPNIFNVLKNKIENRLSSELITDNNDEISLYTLYKSINNAMEEYNKVFVDDTKELRKRINTQTLLNRYFKGEVPTVSDFCPIVEKDGLFHIDVILADLNGKYRGYATIDYTGKIEVNFLRHDYSKEKTIDMLRKHSIKYIEYLNKLYEFRNKYPNIRCEWNSEYPEMNLKLDDGFLCAHFYLERPDHYAFTFSKLEDAEVASKNVKDYGELYDYIEFYKKDLLKRTCVNINDLNDLYKTIVTKELNLEKGPVLNKVK